MVPIGKMIHRWICALAVAGAMIFISWSAPELQSSVPAQVYPASLNAQVSDAPPAPSQLTVTNATSDPPPASNTSTSTAPEQSTSSNTSSATYRVDPNIFFPPGPGQELARENCPMCHQLITFAYVRKSRDGWMRNRANHAGRMPDLSQDQIGVIYEYMAAVINPDLPIPTIPSTWVCSS